MDKKNNWMRSRHKMVVAILKPILGTYMKLKYGIRMEKFHEQGSRPYLIVMNHQTAFDQFFVSYTFNRPVYFIASEDLFSKGWISDVIRWVAAPIPIKKQTTDLQAVKTCIRVAREGGTICLAPEGNRTYHGRTVYIKPGIASLAKKLGMPIAVFRIEGGYGIHPRWSDVVRRGKMRSYVSRVIEPEEYAAMSANELCEVIRKELNVDEGSVSGTFHHKKNAEFLERVMYVCPWCGLSEFESHNDVIRCKKCGRQIRHLPTKELEGIQCDFPHRFVADWYDWQCDYVNQTDLLTLTTEPVFEDTAKVSLVQIYKNKTVLNKNARIRLYGDRITVDETVFPFCDTSAVVVLGKNKLNIYSDHGVYQLKGSKRFNALKYVNFFHRYQNIKGGKNDEFLGL